VSAKSLVDADRAAGIDEGKEAGPEAETGGGRIRDVGNPSRVIARRSPILGTDHAKQEKSRDRNRLPGEKSASPCGMLHPTRAA